MASNPYGQKAAPPPYNEAPPLPGTADPNMPGASVYQQQQPGPAAQPAWGYQPPQPGYQPGYSGYPPPQPQPMMYPPPPQPQQQQQQQQQVVVIGGAQQEHVVHVHHVESFFGQIVMSCFVFWCCNWLFGLIAFILAMVASSTVVNDPNGARNLGKASYGVSTAGIIVTIIIVVIVVGVVVSTVNKADQSISSWSSGSCSHYINYHCYSSKIYTYSSSICSGYYSGGYCYYN